MNNPFTTPYCSMTMLDSLVVFVCSAAVFWVIMWLLNKKWMQKYTPKKRGIIPQEAFNKMAREMKDYWEKKK